MIEDIRRAIHEEYRWLMNLRVPNPMHFGEGAELYRKTKGKEGPPPAIPAYGGKDNVRALLRIEIDHDHLRPFFAEAEGRTGAIWDQLRGRTADPGPPSFEGVVLYEVGRLPEPGWRVINAMREMRR